MKPAWPAELIFLTPTLLVEGPVGDASRAGWSTINRNFFCVRTRACFNFSEATGRRNMTLGTIDLHSEVKYHEEVVDVKNQDKFFKTRIS